MNNPSDSAESVSPTNIVKVYNLAIHEVAQLGPAAFLERTSSVQFIRSRPGPMFTFYPSSVDEIRKNKRLWECVNGDCNAINTEHRKYFVVEFPEWLYLFLRYTPYNKVEKAIAVALTGWYVYNPHKRDIMKNQLERSVFQEVEKLQSQHFSEFEDFSFIMSDDVSLWDDLNEEYYRKERLFISRYDYLFRDTVGNPILIPYVHPVANGRFLERSIFHYSALNLELESSYFTGGDWQAIVQENTTDSLSRSESKREPWEEWKIQYKTTYSLL